MNLCGAPAQAVLCHIKAKSDSSPETKEALSSVGEGIQSNSGKATRFGTNSRGENSETKGLLLAGKFRDVGLRGAARVARQIPDF